jgi:hypothetical protein
MATHNKSYTHKTEYKQRYIIFRENMKKVQFLRDTEQVTDNILLWCLYC